MYGHSAHDSEAAGLVAVVPACVQLRFGPADVALRLLRWVLAVAGAVVALWLGSVLLATPASAAVVVPMAATSNLLKGGKESGDNGDSGSGDGGGDSDSGDNGGGDNGGGDDNGGGNDDGGGNDGGGNDKSDGGENGGGDNGGDND